MGFFRRLWQAVVDRISRYFWDKRGDEEDSHGAPRGAIDIISADLGYASPMALKADDPVLYKWALKGRKFQGVRLPYAVNGLEYNQWQQDRPGLPDPKTIQISQWFGSVHWRYQGETNWKRA